MSISTTMSVTPRHRLVEFGDGYIQRTPLGLHAQRRNITVIHPHLNTADGNTLMNFYEDRHFDGSPVDISANTMFTTAGKFYLQSFEVDMSDDEKRTISATMIEVFDL